MGVPILEALGPNMSTVRRLDQLCSNAHATAGAANATFQKVANAELAPYFADIWRCALVREARISGDNKKPTYARQCGGDFFDHAVSKGLRAEQSSAR
jgi:hypothetical protein